MWVWMWVRSWWKGEDISDEALLEEGICFSSLATLSLTGPYSGNPLSPLPRWC